MTQPLTPAVPRLPFAFWLADRLDKSVIFIVDPQKRLAERLDLFIENTADKTLFFKAISLKDWAPGPDNCHFELRFRRGLLADATLGTSKLPEHQGHSLALLKTGKYQKRVYAMGSWIISEPDDHGGEKPYVSFYLVRSEKGTAGRFNKGDRIRLVLTNISADPKGSTRESRVEIVPRQVYHDGELTLPLNPNREQREQNVLVVNHQGKEYIPIHVAFIGPNDVRNDGIPQGAGHELRLRFTNTARHDTLVFDEDSRFMFSFDHADGDEEEELGEAGNLQSIEFFIDQMWEAANPTAKIAANKVPLESSTGVNPIWELAHFNDLENRMLQPGEHWDFILDISDFSTIAPEGLTPLHIRYESIPGYWDGKLQVEVEKTPMLVRTVGEQEIKTVELDTGQRPVHLMSKVGMTDVNQEKLKVDGHLKLEVGQEEGLGPRLMLVNPAGKPGAAASIDFYTYERAPTPLSPTLRITAVDVGQFSNDLVISSKQLGQENLGLVEHMRIKNEGNVGIGTNAPKQRLHVNGDYYGKGHLFLHAYEGDGEHGIAYVQARDDSTTTNLSLRLRTQNGGNIVEAFHIQHEGNVGIGTVSPDEKLHVDGKGLFEEELRSKANIKAEGRVHDKTGEVMPVGSILAYGGQNLPDGWLWCDGKSFSTGTYSELHGVLGSSRTPDLRSRFIVGAAYHDDDSSSERDAGKDGMAAGLTPREVGDRGGEEAHTLTSEEMPRHWHKINDGGFWIHSRSFEGNDDSDKTYKDSEGGGGTHKKGTDYAGGNSDEGTDAHNNLPPYYALRYMIKG